MVIVDHVQALKVNFYVTSAVLSTHGSCDYPQRSSCVRESSNFCVKKKVFFFFCIAEKTWRKVIGTCIKVGEGI